MHSTDLGETVNHPPTSYRFAAWFDGNVYCNQGTYLGRSITTTCTQSSSGKSFVSAAGQKDIDGVTISGDGRPVAGRRYAGVTFSRDLDLGDYRFTVVNGLIVHVEKD